jgi:hypothetical protein
VVARSQPVGGEVTAVMVPLVAIVIGPRGWCDRLKEGERNGMTGWALTMALEVGGSPMRQHVEVAAALGDVM